VSLDVLLLPGFHGSTTLFDALVRVAPPWARPVPMALPVEPLDSYQSIFTIAVASVRSLSTPIIVAESFSGPLAVLLARELETEVSLLVLVNTFVRFPYPRIRPLLPWAALGRWGRAPAALRPLLAGGNAHWAARLSAEAFAVPRNVFDARVAAVVHADVVREFSGLTCRTVILVGTKDRLIGPSCAGEMCALRPDAIAEKIDAPHLLLQMAPEAAWRRIEDNIELPGSEVTRSTGGFIRA
jgi:pimeloyl-[acyl-carrier protein] methyl ester esterase